MDDCKPLALGPEPWSVCYPEPSVRPDDSRYGANPAAAAAATATVLLLLVSFAAVSAGAYTRPLFSST